MGVTLAQVEGLISLRKLVCGDGHVITAYMTDADGEIACPTCGYQIIDIDSTLLALVSPPATPATGQFELKITQGGSEYDSDDVKAARVNRTEVFNSFDELKRYATDVEGVPMEAFTYRVAGRLNTSYTFQGWTWVWSDMPAPEVTLVDDAKPYTPKLRVSTQVFRVSGSPDIEGWRGRVRNPSFDHMISDYGQDARCCDRATVIGRHMHLSARASVIASKRYYGVAEPAQKLAVRIGDCVTVDGSDWIITNVDSLADPYLLPA